MQLGGPMTAQPGESRASEPHTRPPSAVRTDELIDETLRETFPASDPPSWWAGPPS
jgi:hypothetical protein